MAESSTRLKQAEPDAHEQELEQDIQASLSAALDDLDKLELFADELEQPRRAPAVLPKIPRGMPRLPHGRLIPPLPVSRLSLVPRLAEALRPKAGASPGLEPEAVVEAAKLPVTPVATRPRRWLGVAFALTVALLAVGWWWVKLR